MEPIETIEYKGCKIEVYQDQDAGNPFEEFDQLGTVVIERQRDYDFSQVEQVGSYYDDSVDWKEELWERHRDERLAVVLPFRFRDFGSGASVTSLGLPATLRQLALDCEHMDGYIYLSRASYQTEFVDYGDADLTRVRALKIANSLASELEIWEAWLNGEVYGYIVKSPDGGHIGSCWGFYGETNLEKGYMAGEAKAEADSYLTRAQEAKDYGIAVLLGLGAAS